MALVVNLDTHTQIVTTTTRYQREGPTHGVSIASFLRTADTTAYAALDVISSSTVNPGAIEFPDCGRSGSILRATITIGETDTIAPRLWIFDTEPTNHLDNGGLALVAADMPKIVGRFDFVDADKLLVGVLLNVYFSSGDTTAANEVAMPKSYVNATGSLFGLLQTVPGYTPASAVKFTIRLELERD